MKKYFVLFFVTLIVALNSFGQTPVSKPSPGSPIDEGVVKISTNLIQVDVTVTDANGKIITDLKPEEIEIYENGKKQPITNLSFVSSGRPTADERTTSIKSGDKIPLPPPPQTAAVTQASVRRTIAIVIDDLSMSWESVYYARRAAKKFVDEQMQDGDLVAILRTGGGIGSLQRFTTDKRILYSAIQQIRYNPLGTGGISAMKRIEPTGTEVLEQAGKLPAGIGAEVDAFMAAAEAKSKALRSADAIGTMQYIVSGMKDMPGRKSVMLFSDGFQLFDLDKFGMYSADITRLRVQKLIEEANRAAVVFYPIDPRGLQVGFLQASDNVKGKSEKSSMEGVTGRLKDMRTSQDGINYLAEETGGFAYFNQNDLSKGIARILEDQSYYLVGYVPDSETFDAKGSKYNKLEVRVLRKSAKVRYRSGFFGVTDAKKIAAPPPDVTTNYVAQMRNALLSPFAVNGITLKLNSLFGSSGDNALYVRSLLNIDANDLRFKVEKDGQLTCSFEVLATSFGTDGQLVDQIGKTYTVTVPHEVYTRILAEGIVYHFKFPVKKAGGYQYRVAIRDAVGGNIGAASEFVEVPDLRGGKLGLSSIVVEDMSVDEFQGSFAAGPTVKTDAMRDTAFRQIRVGRVYRYSLEIYNAPLDTQKRPDVETRIRVFRDGKLITDGPPKRFDATGQTDMAHLRFLGGLAIGSQMEPGEYILQIIVADSSGKQKREVATQFIQFEVVN